MRALPLPSRFKLAHHLPSLMPALLLATLALSHAGIASLKLQRTIPLDGVEGRIDHMAMSPDGHPESFQLEKNGNRIFVNVPTAGQIAVVDRVKREVIAKWPLVGAQSNFPMAIDEDHHRLFVGCRKPAKFLVYDTETGKPVAQ